MLSVDFSASAGTGMVFLGSLRQAAAAISASPARSAFERRAAVTDATGPAAPRVRITDLTLRDGSQFVIFDQTLEWYDPKYIMDAETASQLAGGSYRRHS
jgi:hypothetical protein